MDTLGPVSFSQASLMHETVTCYSRGQLNVWAQILRDSGLYAVIERNRVLKLSVMKSVDNRLLELMKGDYAEHDRFIGHVCSSAGHELGREIVHQGAVESSIHKVEDWHTEYRYTVHVVRPK